MKRALSTVLGLLALVVATDALAAVPTTVTFTGRLSTSSGPVNGTVGGVFEIFDAPTGGTQVWTETRSLNASAGLLFVDLGAVTPLDETIFDGQGAISQADAC